MFVNKDVRGIKDQIAATPGVQHVNEVRTMHMGPDFVLVNISADFSDGLPVGEIEQRIAQVDKELKARFPYIKRVFIEAESRRQKP